MELNKDTTIDQFRDEMQRRIVKYHPSSRPVREAVRFARRHEDPAYYRIAVDKVTAQKQYRREVFGPSRLEKALDLLNFGAPREVIVTLLLIVVGVACVEALKYFSSPPEGPVYSELDIDALADRLGIRIDEQVKAADSVPIPMSPAWPDPSGSEGMISSPKTPGRRFVRSKRHRCCFHRRLDSGDDVGPRGKPRVQRGRSTAHRQRRHPRRHDRSGNPRNHTETWCRPGPTHRRRSHQAKRSPQVKRKGRRRQAMSQRRQARKIRPLDRKPNLPQPRSSHPWNGKPQSPESQEQSPPQESAKDVEDEEPTRVTNLFRPGRSQWQAETPSSGRLQGQLYVRGATVPERTEDS